jgi:cytoskeletal protein CcmA (bactofilin family)
MVRGKIEAREIKIHGSVEGHVTAEARILLRSSCEVTGTLASPRIAIEDGARFSGRVETIRVGGHEHRIAAPSEESDGQSNGENGFVQADMEAVSLFAGQPSAVLSPSSPTEASDDPLEALKEISVAREEP